MLKKLFIIVLCCLVYITIIGCGGRTSILTKHNVINGAASKLEIDAPYEYVWETKIRPEMILNREIGTVTIRTDKTKNDYNIFSTQINSVYFNPAVMGIVNDKGKNMIVDDYVKNTINGIIYVYNKNPNNTNITTKIEDMSVNSKSARLLTIFYKSTKSNKEYESVYLFIKDINELWFIGVGYSQNDKKAKDCIDQMLNSIKLAK